MAKETWKTKARNSKYAYDSWATSANDDKLAKYYNKTEGDTGIFYNLGATLNPSTKLSSIWSKHLISSLLEGLYPQGKLVPKTQIGMLTVFRMIKYGTQSTESNAAQTFYILW